MAVVMRSLSIVWAAALLLVGTSAFAQPKPPPKQPEKPVEKPADKPAPAKQEPRRFEPAVVSVARDLAVAIGELDGRAIVAVGPLESDIKTTRAEDLAVLVAAQLGGRRGWAVPKSPEPLAQAIVRGRGSPIVVYLQVRIQRGRLQVTADAHPVPNTVWARVKNPTPGPIAHAFADTSIDAEVRSYLEPVPLVAPLEFSKGKGFEPDILAVACDDFDRDGAPEIVSVSPDQVTLLRLRGEKVHPEAAKLWSELSPREASPWREPMGTAFSAPPEGYGLPMPLDVVVSTTDRAKAVRLDTTLAVTRDFAGFALAEGGALSCARMQTTTITGPLDRCGDSEAAPKRASVTGRFDSYAAANLVEPNGKPFEVWAGRESGVVELRDSDGHFAKIPAAGAQLAVGDLDQDGTPEILTSLDVERGKPDAVVVFSWERNKGGPPKEKLRIPIASGVHALAVCPASGTGRVPFVIASTDQIVVAR